MSVRRFVLGSVVVLMMYASDAQAQGFGVTGGAQANPDQFYVGGLYEFGPLTERVTLRPGGGIGMGDGASLFAGNIDLTYAVPVWRRSPWRPYVGGGPAINHYRLELYSETEPGATAIAGLRHAAWFTELRVGFFDSPRMTMGVGYSFANTRRTRAGRTRG